MIAGRHRPLLRGRVPAVAAALVLVVGGACGVGDDQGGAPVGAESQPPPPSSPERTAPASEPTTTSSAPGATEIPRARPEPVAVSIPALGVESELLHLGLRPDGTAEVPDEYDLASWYRHGGRPGGHGPTVVLGHVDSPVGPAVFARLAELTTGDLVHVSLADGTTATYEVSGTIEFHKDAVPTGEVFGATSDDVLRLITCSGPFDRQAHTYTENLVVTADRVA